MEQEKAQKVKTAALEKLKTKGLAQQVNEAEIEEPPPQEDVGVQDIKELIIFVFALAELTIEVAGDGIGIMDIFEVLRDDEVKKAFGPAVRGASDVPNEVADLSTSEMRELADLLWHEAWSLWESITS